MQVILLLVLFEKACEVLLGHLDLDLGGVRERVHLVDVRVAGGRDALRDKGVRLQ